MALLVYALFVTAGCSGGGSSADAADPSTGRVVFSVNWDRATSMSMVEKTTRYGLVDCADVATVTAIVLDMDGVVLAIGGPWPCSDHRGSIASVPAGGFVRVAVIGQSGDGLSLYYGESEPFFLPPGDTVDAGIITAVSFVPTLSAPEDGSRVAIGSLTFIWNPIAGAKRYQISIASTPDFRDEDILQTIWTKLSSFQFDTGTLEEGGVYFWRIQAEDGAGFLGGPSTQRTFQVTRELLSVDIIEPFTGTQVIYGTPIAFDAIVSDADGELLSPNVLSGVQWWSEQDGILAQQLAFSTNVLSPGTHTITLDVTSAAGLTGSAHVVVEVTDNAPPTASILLPEHESNITLQPGESLTCQGTGIDPEDGNLSEAQMRWRMIHPDDPETLLWEAFGATAMIDYQAFRNVSGPYRITLTATDSEGATDTDIVDVTVEIVVNETPEATILRPLDGTLQSIGPGDALVCRGNAVDPEDGALTGQQLHWRMVRVDNPDTILWESYGTVAFIDYPVFASRSGAYRISLTATDSQGASDTASVEVLIEIITVNQSPEATITLPETGIMYDEVVPVAGSGWDPEDGPLPGSNLRWELFYFMDGQYMDTGWDYQGSETTIDIGFLYGFDTDQFRIRLTVTDSQGATGTAVVDFYSNW
ncbi:REJ domain-containing protein [Desulfatitalea alkaliphila]|uniref:Ig-like domain-containing protein n=1 Tax=Desulfatitalea alkaliphila TaxID=2929485 RepID=A0AA41R4N7_9BACT|nr:REJ domain-containing protein [Desulfatitalea alkaliphila]MCJ8501847.1 hypothetical protein [Desulfatitalea alkaliphila]